MPNFDYLGEENARISIYFSLFALFSVFYSSEIVHVWKDSRFSGEGPTHSAQMVIDGVNYLSETVYSIGAQPSKALTDWVADWAAPSYWKPNTEIIVSVRIQKKAFETHLL